VKQRIAFFLLLAFSCAPSVAGAFETKHTPKGAAVRWNAKIAVWQIDPSLDDVKGGAKAFRQAAAAWSGQCGAPQMSVVSSKVAGGPALDGVNGIYFMPDGYGPAGNALAITIVHADEATGAIVDADIVINGKFDVEAISPATNGDEIESPPENEHDASADKTYDVARVAAHEMGHALGLGDEADDATAIMYPFVAADRPLDASPGADDLGGICSLYDGATNASPSPARLRGCAVGGGMSSEPNPDILAALALATYLVRKRKPLDVQ
jgi:hypothetical protein